MRYAACFHRVLLPVLLLLGSAGAAQPAATQPAAATQPWPAAKAWAWYAKVGAIRGVNYVPSTAVNMLEWWQAETFDPTTIDRELGYARAVGYTSVRCNLPELVWEHDPAGLKKRLATFLGLAHKHGLTVMLCLFDDVNFAKANPQLGPQPAPVPGVHNSRWVPSPAPADVDNRRRWPVFERYVKDIVGTFARDERVLVWDLYNEPGNGGLFTRSLPLMEAAFGWARQMRPVQPLTTGPFIFYFTKPTRRMYELSDIISFHHYGTAAEAEKLIQKLQVYGRPLVCTETVRRVPGKDYADLLPVYARHRVSWYSWGLVAGKQQTYLPWETTDQTINDPWHWDMLYPDGRPYRPAEVALIKAFRFAPVAQQPAPGKVGAPKR
ncbi:glycoside hydrolase 5 family protein [Hymenobacter weizhouensis]|uniref:1,4-beta-xylanase n=1 Tax=Hymenobacter sp. YIM 151500-1 TaxID=2987689 RepID=UPI002227384A|nr:1,4-beta-xylanase [Hymenobacter sp. YIM 151500-1]UYZ63855.1 1,4-beta-xylanase [Hymenobacter sp. YIM 151500-1]